MKQNNCETVKYILQSAFSDIGVSVQDTEVTENVKKICSIACKAVANVNLSPPKTRGLSSIFDSLFLKKGEKPIGNILVYDDKSGIKVIGKTQGGMDIIIDSAAVLSDLEESENIDHWLGVLKKYAYDIPCSEGEELSVFTYSRIASAFAGCLEAYYRESPLPCGEDICSENSLLLYTADFSGIQNFIYTINDKALKTLRAKSFFVEIVMAQLIAEITDAFGLPSSNALYSGGGHCYVLLPASDDCRERIERVHRSINDWCTEHFGNSLSVIYETAVCNINDFTNTPAGAYERLFKGISAKMARKKLRKYCASDIIRLNAPDTVSDKNKECRVCGAPSVRLTDKDDICSWCSLFAGMSDAILDPDESFLVLDRPIEGSAPFFSAEGNAYFCFAGSNVTERLISAGCVRRIFCKNTYPSKAIKNSPLSSLISVCDYSYSKLLNELSEENGIDRLGVLRMDVDNLGSTFISGFNITDGNGDIFDSSYVGIERTALLSVFLTEFFKKNLTYLLENKEYKISVLYAGGDDVFLVGNWEHVILASVDIIKAFKELTGGRLSISGGIGLYKSKYPVARFAAETETLEACSKNNKRHNKDSVTLFSADGNQTYSWKEFEEKVLGEKLALLEDFLTDDSEKGNSFLYKLLENLRGITEKGEKLNIARTAYLLSRMCDQQDIINQDKNNKEKKAQAFSLRIFGWLESALENGADSSDLRQLITAIIIFVYKRRGQQNEQ